MVKLTPELIQQSLQYLNPLRDRELDLRGYKIPVIENLGATLDQFDTIDFSDNEIRKLDGFPHLKRLKCLLFNNNRIVRLGEGLEECLPALDSLILTNNLMQELGDLDPLASLKTLAHLSLLHNPVSTKPHYREYVIYKIPQVRVLDFRRVKGKERLKAAELFKSTRGKELQKKIVKKTKTFTPGAEIKEQPPKTTGHTEEEIKAIKEAIAKATSLEEMERLSTLLRQGQVPKQGENQAGVNGSQDEEME
ncbi:unnamed protein product [Darwinula stevensoni]|uniref:Probable U2 small nuclear ribonucleoprotein A' n=1 Tax=Darwinula stevensoni TaxID=69355 RepID=A0A7R9A0V0_9CRUS|nr:unnamed protein product [Darwinula stevensoni]CAG0886356.1 unnamed protein product [Darwinula stevensoni]